MATERWYEVWSTYKVPGVAHVKATSAVEAIEKGLHADEHGIEFVFGEPVNETKMKARRVRTTPPSPDERGA